MRLRRTKKKADLPFLLILACDSVFPAFHTLSAVEIHLFLSQVSEASL